MRATRAIVDLDAIAANTAVLRGLLADSCALLAVVKADAYGHGAPAVAAVALQSGASLLGVATVSEGQRLRAAGILAPILLLSSIDASEVAEAVQANLEITVAEEDLLRAVQDAAHKQVNPSPVSVHLKIDTGLRRYGAAPELALSLAQRIASDPALRFAGISTHFASSDEPDEPFTDEQARRFGQAVAAMGDLGVPLPPCHVANSAAMLRGIGTSTGIARAGIALYGVPPADEVSLASGMRPAMRLESRVARVFAIAPGDTVGYNRTFRACQAQSGALVPIGYADGYRRSLAGRAWAQIGDHRAGLLGRVSMDQVVFGLPADAEVRVGDRVQLMGDGGEGLAPTVRDLAEMMGTNTYEVLVGIRERVPRLYVRHGELFKPE